MQTIFDLEPEQRGKVVHRASLLAELLRPVNDAKKKTNKRVIDIKEVDDGRLAIHFDDSTVFYADAVIGADGVRGYVRSYILGHDHPATQAQRAGFWDARSLVPIEKAKEIFGSDLFDEHRQYAYIGDGGFFMHDKHDDGKMMQFVVSGLVGDGTWGNDEWSRKLDREGLEELMGSWMVPSIEKPFIEVGCLNNFNTEHANKKTR